MPSQATALRTELRKRAEAWAARTRLPVYRSTGAQPTVLFRATPDGSRHGNFFDGAWTAINAAPDWQRRLAKPHQRQKALRPSDRQAAKELDSSNSSDALLMNCFCPSGAAHRIASHLGLGSADTEPIFGFRARVKLESGRDRTEIDMVLGETLVEAKLTERDFTSRTREQVLRYHGVQDVFDLQALTDGERVRGYQLIRNVLAAHQRHANLIVLVDARRTDLIDRWNRVHASVVPKTLRERCRLATWQDIAQATRGEHRSFLREKYGL